MTSRWEPMLLELDGARRGRLIAFATMLAGADAAEDLVQDAVIATFSRTRGFDHVAQAESYVRRAIATRFIDTKRSHTSRSRAERRSAPLDAVADATGRVDARDALTTALMTLNPKVRACVVLRYLEDLSIRDTATALGLSEGAVKRYVSDGLGALNALLGTYEQLTDSVPTTVLPGGTR
jgi:RNA polymerase sigma factor (sigma-70 family)